jgi:hypothetical protein
LRAFHKEIFAEVFGHMRKEATADWRKLDNF